MPAISALRTVDEIIDNDEDYAVEFKSTARWDLRKGEPNKAMDGPHWVCWRLGLLVSNQ